jgi:hypothetical protein
MSDAATHVCAHCKREAKGEVRSVPGTQPVSHPTTQFTIGRCPVDPFGIHAMVRLSQ